MTCCYTEPEKLSKVKKFSPIKGVEIEMYDGKKINLIENDKVAIQCWTDKETIVVVRGRVKSVEVFNYRSIGCQYDNRSYVNIDCSENFESKVVKIKLATIIDIQDINYEFEVITKAEIEEAHIKHNMDGANIPVREGGMYEPSRPGKYEDGSVGLPCDCCDDPSCNCSKSRVEIIEEQSSNTNNTCNECTQEQQSTLRCVKAVDTTKEVTTEQTSKSIPAGAIGMPIMM